MSITGLGIGTDDNGQMKGTQSSLSGDVQTTLGAEWDGIDLTLGTKIVKTTYIRMSYREDNY